MLTAKRSNGDIISLGQPYTHDFLKRLRQREKFFCSGCGERLILKLGTKRIPHFAHEKGSVCTCDYERESEYHMRAKLQLYEWLLMKQLSPTLETYYPEIKQRSDISFLYKGKQYCLEFQCSPLSEDVFRKRTNGYRNLSIEPIWILAGKNVNRRNNSIISLSSFHYLFLNQNTSQKWYIHLYCPQIQRLIRLNDLYPISARNAFSRISIFELDELDVTDLLNPQVSFTLQFDKWSMEMKSFKTAWLLHSSSFKNPLISELYNRSLNPQLIPPYVGVPLKNNPALETAPFIWQTYFFIDHLFEKKAGHLITVHDVYQSFSRRIKQGHLRERSFVIINNKLLPLLLKEYLFFLTKLHVLEVVNETSYKVKESVEIISRLDEWYEAERRMIKYISVK